MIDLETIKMCIRDSSKVKSMVGEVKYKNLDDDPVIDNRDRQIIGNTNPDYQYGINHTLEWKNWTFSFFLQGTQGNDCLLYTSCS